MTTNETTRPVDVSASPRRRKVLAWLSATLGTLAAAIIATPVVGFIVAPARRGARPRWHRVGRVEDFAVGTTKKVVIEDPEAAPWSGAQARQAVHLRRSEEGFTAFSVFCTHTGCPVRWVEGARLFLCPCHGGAFHADGEVAAGPPPSPLPRHDTRVRNGFVEVQSRAVLLARRS